MLPEIVMRSHDKIKEKETTIKYLAGALAGAFVLIVVSMAGWATAPSRLVVYQPSDLTKTSSEKVGYVPPGAVYDFAYGMFTRLNLWRVNGLADYPNQINAWQHYLTPECNRFMWRQFQHKKNELELEGRTRHVKEIPGRTMTPERVTVHIENKSWTVSMDLHIQERLSGDGAHVIKDSFVNYQMNVITYAIDPTKNAHGMALDCNGIAPTVLEMEGDTT